MNKNHEKVRNKITNTKSHQRMQQYAHKKLVKGVWGGKGEGKERVRWLVVGGWGWLVVGGWLWVVYLS